MRSGGNGAELACVYAALILKDDDLEITGANLRFPLFPLSLMHSCIPALARP